MLTLRALRARAGQSLALFTMGVLAVAGCVFSVGYSRAANTSVGSAGVLLLLGAFAIAAHGTAFVRNRRHEIALAQLRGRYGFRLLWYAAKDPAAVLLAATAVGIAVGWAVARVAANRWVGPEATVKLAADEWAAAAIVLVVGVTIVVVAGWSVTYEPLKAKLDDLGRPRAMTAPAMFLSLLVLVGAVVSVYQARQLSPANANWLSFVSPVLVGLAAGQIGIWMLALCARLAMANQRLDRRLGSFLTWRRLSRRTDGVVVIRIAVAAAVVMGIAANAWAGSGAWLDQTARVETGGPVAYTVPTGGLQAYAASHMADPHGRWLMAMAASPDASASSYRGVFVDAPRWNRVVGAFFSGTPVAGVSHDIGALSSRQVVRTARGKTFHFTFSARSARRVWQTINVNHVGLGVRLSFTISYVDSNGAQQSLQVPVHPGRRPAKVQPGVVGYSASIPGCSRACAVEQVTAQGLTHKRPLLITDMSFAGIHLLPGRAPGLALAKNSTHLRAEPSPGGLNVWLAAPYSPQPLLSWDSGTTPVALVTPGLHLEQMGGKPAAYGLDGNLEPVRLAGEAAVLPLLGRAGILLDLGTDLRGAGTQGVETKTVVIARSDTPPGVLRKLAATGVVGARHTVQQTLANIQHSYTGRRTALYVLIAVFGLLIAAVAVVSSTAGQRRERRTEAASLRTIGVGEREVDRGYRVEAATLGVAVTVVAAVATWVGCRALLAYLPLVQPGQFGLSFDATPRADLAAAIAVLSGAFLALIVFADFRLLGRSSPPSTLRDENR
jgi:putative ABC transport system permease protein